MVTKVYLYAADEACFAGTAKAFAANDPTDHSAEPVDSPGGIAKALNKYSELQWVLFDSHGKPGVLDLPLAQFTAANAPLLAPCSSALTSDARVLFLGCSVADGAVGRAFLVAVGKALLMGNGGVVGGSTVGTYTACIEWLSFFTETYLPRWGVLRLIQFNDNGDVINEAFADHSGLRGAKKFLLR